MKKNDEAEHRASWQKHGVEGRLCVITQFILFISYNKSFIPPPTNDIHTNDHTYRINNIANKPLSYYETITERNI